MTKIIGILLNIEVVCSLVCIIAMILDWYNPHMNFSGHILPVQAILYAAVLTGAFLFGIMKKGRS